jgi:hypothetical protein
MVNLPDQIAAPQQERDMDWIKQSLQAAIELELSTLPLYLSMMYSLWVQNYTAYNSVRSIAMEEMVHMAIVCNILSALGGTPRIKNLDPGFPCQGLPGGAEPDLKVGLAKYSKRQLQNFMRLEAPLDLLPPMCQKETYPTIGNLYAAIREAVLANADEVRQAIKQGGDTSNQIGDNIGFKTVTYTEGQDPLQQVLDGIDEIVQQGEGSPLLSLHAGPAFEGEESHYAKYAELFYGRRYQQPVPDVPLTRETEPLFFSGRPIMAPDVANILYVPTDGYAKLLAADPNAAAVEKSLAAFDQAYSDILGYLDAMWNGPADKSWPTFGKAVSTMVELRVLACFNIMKYQVPQELVAKLQEFYPDEYSDIAVYTDLNQPVLYGPRFRNVNAR